MSYTKDQLSTSSCEMNPSTEDTCKSTGVNTEYYYSYNFQRVNALNFQRFIQHNLGCSIKC